MSYFFRQRYHFEKFDEAKVVRAKTTPQSTAGSFAPRSESGMKATGAPGPGNQLGFVNFGGSVADALDKVKSLVQDLAAQATGSKRQPGVTDKASLLAQAAEAKPLFDRMMETVAAGMDALCVTGNDNIMDAITSLKNSTEIERPMVFVADLKGGKRLDEKAAIDYDGDYSRIKDMVRGTVLVPKADTLDDALEFLRKANIKVADAPKDRITAPGPDGYRDVKLNVELPNGHIGEVLVMTPAMFVTKMTKAHAIYEEIRPLTGELERTGRTPTMEEMRLIEAVNVRQRAVNDEAWAKDLRVRG